MNEFEEIVILLKKTFPILLENLGLMKGCDISSEEINSISQNQELSLEILSHVAGDHFFQTYCEELTLSEEEALEVSKFLYSSAEHFLEDLKIEFPFLIE